VISNLIENAVTAPCDKEARTVNVNAFRSDDSIIFQVCDNGNGISKENLSQVFEKGFTTKASGTGQGLAFVKAQIESWGGQISIGSESLCQNS
jgi:signal transduction histidine kinase